MIRFDNIPAALRERDQWVLWKTVAREDKATKVPVRPDGGAAKSNDPATWATFDAARSAFDASRHAGLGYVFAAADPFVGVDLDGCRDPGTGRVAAWARETVLKLATYAEVSPSGTGVKLFARGKSPFDGGRKAAVGDAERLCDKAPAVEVYDAVRFFAVTGQRLQGPAEPADVAEALAWLKERFWRPEPARPAADFNSDSAVVERARKYLAKLPVAVSGCGGHNATFRAACVLALGFDLPEAEAVALLLEWNRGCQPPWAEKDIARKVREAAKQPGPRGYIRSVPVEGWARVAVPEYRPAPAQPVTPAPRSTTLVDASRRYLDALRAGEEPLAGTSIPDLDDALDGGIGFGEMAIFAARPSHGKSAIALQCLHNWTAKGTPHGAPAVIISEEMGELALGKRTLQHITPLDQRLWAGSVDRLEDELGAYAAGRHPCHIVENCGTAAAAVAAVERHVAEDGCRYAVVDYAQLLRSPGNGRYEQTTNTSIALRQLASRTKVALVVLCQLSRAVEQRGGEFLPLMSDLKDTGQLEQDADVIAMLCWPHKLNPAEDKGRYQFFVMKNRNRAIRSNIVECLFTPERQMVRDRGADAGGTSGVF